MDTHAITERENLRETATWMGGYVKAIGDQDSAPSRSQLRELKERINSLGASCKAAAPNVRRICEHYQEKHPERLQWLLVGTSKIVTHLRGLAEPPQFRTLFPEFWTDDFQRTLEDTLELFAEEQETLALELSAGFYDEIEDARKEACVDTASGKRRMPTD